MREKGSILADEIMQDYYREKYYKDLSKRLREDEKKWREERKQIMKQSTK